MTRKIFEYLLIAVVVILTFASFELEERSWRALLSSIVPNIVSVLIAFLAMYFFFTRREIDLNEIIKSNSDKKYFRKRIIPASRRLEKAIHRSNEAMSMISQLNTISSDELSAIIYKHQVMTSDIFEAYRIVNEVWSTTSSRNYILDPVLKSKEFVLQALEHSAALRGDINEHTNLAITTAFQVLEHDLNMAQELLTID